MTLKRQFCNWLGFGDLRRSLKKNIRTCNQFQLSNWYCNCFRSHWNLGLFKKSVRLRTEPKTGSQKSVWSINWSYHARLLSLFSVDRFNGRNFWIRFRSRQGDKENWFPSRWPSRACSPRIGLFCPFQSQLLSGPAWSNQDFADWDGLGTTKKGKHHDADIIFGWNKNEGNWFAVYLLEGYSKDHQSLIQQDTFVRNLNKCGLRLNEIGISTVAFEYGPWSRSQVGKPEGNSSPSNSLPLWTSGLAYRDAIDQIIGDKHIVCPGIEMLQNFANKKNVKSKLWFKIYES